MKIACVFLGFFSGVMGFFGGFLTASIAALGIIMEYNPALIFGDLGALAVSISFVIMVTSVIAYFRPKDSGFFLIIFAIISFFTTNFFSAPITLFAGILGVSYKDKLK